MMETWNSETSVLSPLVVGIHPEGIDTDTVMKRCFTVSAVSVPISAWSENVKIKNSFKTQSQKVIRQVSVADRQDNYPHPYIARYVDRVNGRTALPGNSIWEVGLAPLKPGQASPAIDEACARISSRWC